MDHSTTHHPVVLSFLHQNFHPSAPCYKTPPRAALHPPFPSLHRALDQSLIFLSIRQAAILSSHSACFALAQTSPIKLQFTGFSPFLGSFTHGTCTCALRFNKEQECTMDDKSSPKKFTYCVVKVRIFIFKCISLVFYVQINQI